MTRRVAVIGGAASPIGKLQTAPDAPLQALEHEILAPLVLDAMAAAGLPKEEIDALIFALCRPYTLQKYFATFLANYLRLPLEGTIMEVLGNGMTGGLAFDQAVNTVAMGHADVALALGINMESQASLGGPCHVDDAGDRRRRLPHHLRLHADFLVRDGRRALHARARRHPGGAGERRRQGSAARRAQSDRPVPQAADAGGGAGRQTHRRAARPLRGAAARRRGGLPGRVRGGGGEGNGQALRAGARARVLSRGRAPDQRGAERHDGLHLGADAQPQPPTGTPASALQISISRSSTHRAPSCRCS